MGIVILLYAVGSYFVNYLLIKFLRKNPVLDHSSEEYALQLLFSPLALPVELVIIGGLLLYGFCEHITSPEEEKEKE